MGERMHLRACVFRRAGRVSFSKRMPNWVDVSGLCRGAGRKDTRAAIALSRRVDIDPPIQPWYGIDVTNVGRKIPSPAPYTHSALCTTALDPTIEESGVSQSNSLAGRNLVIDKRAASRSRHETTTRERLDVSSGKPLIGSRVHTTHDIVITKWKRVPRQRRR